MATAEYNFFQLNDFGVVDAARRIKLDDDASASSLARSLFNGKPVEVWSGKRRVCFIPQTVERRAADRRAA